MNIKIKSSLHLGKVRAEQQDQLMVLGNLCSGSSLDRTESKSFETANGVLVCLADGMGGAHSGDLAAQTVINTIKEMAEVGFDAADGQQEIVDRMKVMLETANDNVLRLASEDPAKKGMGSTAVLGILLDNRIHLAWVGDSRCYLQREGKISLLTKDHSLVQSLIDQGRISQEEAKYHPNRNVITQSIGMTGMKPDFRTVDLKSGDYVLFCSDGLSGMLGDRDINSILMKAGNLNAASSQLLREALDAGGEDNISLVLVNCGYLHQPWLGNNAYKGVQNPSVPKTKKSLGYWTVRFVVSILLILLLSLLGYIYTDGASNYVEGAADLSYVSPDYDPELGATEDDDERRDSLDIAVKWNADSYFLVMTFTGGEAHTSSFVDQLENRFPDKSITYEKDGERYDVMITSFGSYEEAEHFKEEHNLKNVLVVNAYKRPL